MASGLIDTYRFWFALRDTPGVGSVLFKRLLTTFGSPEAVFNAPDHELKRIRGLSPRMLAAIRNSGRRPPDGEIAAVARSGYKVAALTDPHYPKLLKQIPDPPALLTYIGTLDATAPCIAIVGSRQATPYGVDTAFRLGRELAGCGFDIVSGMAVGIDTAAHNGALDAAGRTLAVLGSGLNTIYPRQNRALYHRIAAHGAVVSEFPVNASPDARHFPRRNRIIAGISAGTVVVEAAARSGSLITARLATEYNREVFAVPGSIRSFRSTGTHALLKQGAKLVENKQDVIEELSHLVSYESPDEPDTPSPLAASVSGPEPRSSCGGSPEPCPTDPANPVSGKNSSPKSFAGTTGVARKILSCLGPYPTHMDTIIDQSGLDTGVVSATLLELELSGVVIQTPGKYFSIAEETP